MDLSKKLQIPSGTKVFVVNSPKNLDLELPITRSRLNNAVLIFVLNSKVLKKDGSLSIEAAKENRLSWIAYPKAGKLETDLNRDKLAKLLEPHGIKPVRLVSLNDTWSAMRFRPKSK